MEGRTDIESKGFTPTVAIDPNKSGSILVKGDLERDDDELELWLGEFCNRNRKSTNEVVSESERTLAVASDSTDVCRVESSVHLVENEERRRMISAATRGQRRSAAQSDRHTNE